MPPGVLLIQNESGDGKGSKRYVTFWPVQASYWFRIWSLPPLWGLVSPAKPQKQLEWTQTPIEQASEKWETWDKKVNPAFPHSSKTRFSPGSLSKLHFWFYPVTHSYKIHKKLLEQRCALQTYPLLQNGSEIHSCTLRIQNLCWHFSLFEVWLV